MIRNRNLVVDVSTSSLPCWSVDRVHFFEWSSSLESVENSSGSHYPWAGDTVRERRSNLEMEVSKYNKYLEGKRIPVSVRSELWLVHTVSSALSRESFITPGIDLVDISGVRFQLYPISIFKPYKSFFVTRPTRILDKFTRIPNRPYFLGLIPPCLPLSKFNKIEYKTY